MASKPNLLLLHGALGSANQMLPLKDVLKDQYTIHTYDFPGHGGKDFAEHSLTIPILGEHLLDHLREFQLIGTHVFGYSMGGYAALWLEANKAGIFSSIMTLGTKFNWTTDIAAKESKLIAPEFLELKASSFVSTLIARHFPYDWKRLCNETAHLMQHLAKHPLTNDEMGNISCDVRIALGDRDHMVTLEESAHAYTALSNSSLLVMPDTPHLFEKISYTHLAEEIKRFIK
ncbi:MAG: alpha/beta fold hydrolase [Bacteroidia bacterium]